MEANSFDEIWKIADWFGVERRDDITDLKTGLLGGGIGDDVANHTLGIVWITAYSQHRAVCLRGHYEYDADGRNEVDSSVNEYWRDKCFTPLVECSQNKPQHECNTTVRNTKKVAKPKNQALR